MSSEVQRKLTTILAADAAGYSRVMEADEVRGLGELDAARRVFAKFIELHHGRIANTAGDGLIAEFPSVVEAVQCAIDVQQELGSRPGGTLSFRIGIHLGDVMVYGTDLLGEGVNLAARLQTMAEPGGILISQQVYDHVHAKLSVTFEYLGDRRPKNLSQDVAVYRVARAGARPAIVKEKLAASEPRSWRVGQRLPTRSSDLRERVLRHARVLGIVWAALLVVDLATGSSFWAHWPAVAFLTILGLEATPLFVRGWFSIQFARGTVVLLGLALVNIVTWSGYPWVFWVAGVLLVIGLVRRVAASS